MVPYTVPYNCMILYIWPLLNGTPGPHETRKNIS